MLSHCLNILDELVPVVLVTTIASEIYVQNSSRSNLQSHRCTAKHSPEWKIQYLGRHTTKL